MYPVCPEAQPAVRFEPWVAKAVARFGLVNTLRHPWRPENGSWNM
jgi:hypothetical protein